MARKRFDGTRSRGGGILFAAGTVIGVLILIGLILAGWPRYGVYQQRLAGQAALERAEFEKKVAIEEARAKDEAADLLAAAEIKRARGVAEANTIIGDSLKGNDAYLRYLWIQGLQDGSSEVIYIPTEIQLPILEATRKLQ